MAGDGVVGCVGMDLVCAADWVVVCEDDLGFWGRGKSEHAHYGGAADVCVVEY